MLEKCFSFIDEKQNNCFISLPNLRYICQEKHHAADFIHFSWGLWVNSIACNAASGVFVSQYNLCCIPFIHYRCITHVQQLCWWNSFGRDESVMFSSSSAFALVLQWAWELPGWSFSEVSCLQVLAWILISSLTHEDWLFLRQDPLQKLV